MRIALVTGASKGLGREIALMLGRCGYTVVVNYRSSANEAAELADVLGKNCMTVKADVRSFGEVIDMASRIDSDLGRLDAVVNNAGITRDNLLIRQSVQEWQEVIDTNLKGAFNVIRTMAPLMKKSGGGHIVNISSYSGVKGKAGQAAYSASKSALLGLTYSAASELAGDNIRVNAVLPGYMRTSMGMKAGAAMESAIENSLLNRLSDPSEVAAFIAYILTTENITGQVFSLDSRIL